MVAVGKTLTDIFGKGEVGDKVTAFDFGKINGKDGGVDKSLRLELSPSYRTLNSETVKQLNDQLKIAIAGTVRILGDIEPRSRSWAAVMSSVMRNPLLQPMESEEIYRADQIVKNSANEFKFNGSSDAAIVKEANSWILSLIGNDTDFVEATRIDANIVAKTVTQAGEVATNVKYCPTEDDRRATLVDIGILQFPDSYHPFFKERCTYRFKLDVWWGHTRFGGGEPEVGISGEFSSRRFQPRTAIIQNLNIFIQVEAVRQAEDLFTQPSPFTPVYQTGDRDRGIGGYDLASPADQAFAYDFDSSGKTDHIVLFRPGTGTCNIVGRGPDGKWKARYANSATSGIGGYDLGSPTDCGLAFDYDSSGKLDHLIFYRPGTGAIYIVKPTGNDTFTPVYAQGQPGTGIGGYDLAQANDRIFAFDYAHTGKQDHLCLYRAGQGIFWILRKDPQTNQFAPVFTSQAGIGGYDLGSPADHAFAVDWDRSGKMDHIALHRGGAGNFWVLRNDDNGRFTHVLLSDAGLAGYDLLSPADRVFAFDWDGTGRRDHIALYRPGTGTFWVVKRVPGDSGNAMQIVMREGDPGKGVGGCDLKGAQDRIFALDYERSGKMDHLVVVRSAAGPGRCWILQRD